MMAADRANRLQGLALVVLAGVASSPTAASAQVGTVSPPAFSACAPATPPELPTRWRAVGLMTPFVEGQLDVGEFVYDGTVPAMRATVYGLESGAVDLLITETSTYQVFGPHGAPTGCTSLGRRFGPPPVRWLSAQAACVGEARLATTAVQWWKTPGVESQATWHWFKTGTRLPWRSMFVSRSPDLAVIGDYSITNFPTFIELPDTGLPRLRDFCVSRADQGGADAAAGARTARDLMAIRNEAAEAERLQRIETLIPGLGHQACSRMTPVRWPDQFVATAIITPNSFNDNPYLSLILYDWSEAATQLTMMWQGRPPVYQRIIALTKGIGYQPGRLPSGALSCQAAYPGIVRPDWMKAASCRCKGVIDHNSALSPNGVTQILACPLKWQPNRIDWTWYTTEGHPVVFAEAGARGVGLMLADYHQWMPGQKVPPAEFDLPKECVAPDNAALAPGARNPSCSDCHTMN